MHIQGGPWATYGVKIRCMQRTDAILVHHMQSMQVMLSSVQQRLSDTEGMPQLMLTLQGPQSTVHG